MGSHKAEFIEISSIKTFIQHIDEIATLIKEMSQLHLKLLDLEIKVFLKNAGVLVATAFTTIILLSVGLTISILALVFFLDTLFVNISLYQLLIVAAVTCLGLAVVLSVLTFNRYKLSLQAFAKTHSLISRQL